MLWRLLLIFLLFLFHLLWVPSSLSHLISSPPTTSGPQFLIIATVNQYIPALSHLSDRPPRLCTPVFLPVSFVLWLQSVWAAWPLPAVWLLGLIDWGQWLIPHLFIVNCDKCSRGSQGEVSSHIRVTWGNVSWCLTRAFLKKYPEPLHWICRLVRNRWRVNHFLHSLNVYFKQDYSSLKAQTALKSSLIPSEPSPSRVGPFLIITRLISWICRRSVYQLRLRSFSNHPFRAQDLLCCKRCTTKIPPH